MVPATPLRATQFGTIIAATPAHEREEDQRLIGEILDSMNNNINANAAENVDEEQAESAGQGQDPAHWNVTMKALVQMAILDMLAKWETYTKDADPDKKALSLALKLVESVLRTMKNKFEADGRVLFSGPDETEGGTVTTGSGDDIPLYRWLLPRLCFAASEFQTKPLLKPFANDTLDLAAYLIDSVGQYLDTQASEGAMGMYLGRSLVSGLTQSCNGELSTIGKGMPKLMAFPVELLHPSPPEQELFTIQTVAPEAKRRSASSQQAKEVVSNAEAGRGMIPNAPRFRSKVTTVLITPCPFRKAISVSF